MSRSRGQSFRRPSAGDDSRKGLSSQADGPRRSSRPSYVQDKPSSAEAVYEVGTSTTSSKGKSRQPSLMEVPSTESESGAIPPEPALPAAPKLPRKPSQDPRYSPPLSPQTPRTPAAPPAPTRRPSKRPTAETAASAPAAIPKKGARSGEPNIVPPISVLIVDGAFLRNCRPSHITSDAVL